MMWTTEASRKTIATKEKIWTLWADVQHWNMWDNEVETSGLSGDFQKGSKGFVKSKNGPKAKFEITELTRLKSFTSRSLLPFCRMDIVHSITEHTDGIEVKHQVIMTGLMTFLFSKIIGEKIKVGLPNAVERLIVFAEKDLLEDSLSL